MIRHNAIIMQVSWQYFSSFLTTQDTYDELFTKSKSEGTLYNLKNVFDYRAVTGLVKQDVNAHVAFMEWVTRVYTVALCYHICGIQSAEEEPTKCAGTDEAERREVLRETSQKIVEMVYRPTEGEKMLNEEELGECSSELCTFKQNLPGAVTVNVHLMVVKAWALVPSNECWVTYRDRRTEKGMVLIG